MTVIILPKIKVDVKATLATESKREESPKKVATYSIGASVLDFGTVRILHA